MLRNLADKLFVHDPQHYLVYYLQQNNHHYQTKFRVKQKKTTDLLTSGISKNSFIASTSENTANDDIYAYCDYILWDLANVSNAGNGETTSINCRLIYLIQV